MRTLTLLFFTTLLLAGCTSAPGQVDGLFGGGEDEVPETDGLSLSFEQLGTFALETEEVTLELSVENVGQADAESIEAQVFGPSWISGSRSIGTLQGVDRAAGQAGESAVAEWSLSPPDVDTDTSQEYDATAQVTYVYETTATISAALSPEGFTTSQSTVEAGMTDGPVQMSTDLETPIPTQGETSHTIPLTITNAGDGVINSQVDLTGQLVGATGGISLTGCDTTVSVDEEADVTCTLETPEDGVSVDTTADIRITARYEYQEETSTTVTVRGVQGAE